MNRSKKQNQRLEEIDVIRYEDEKIHVLGRSGNKLYHIVHDAQTKEILEEDSFKQKEFGEEAGLCTFLATCGVGLVIVGGAEGGVGEGGIPILTNAQMLLMLPAAVAGYATPFLDYLRPSVRERLRKTKRFNKTTQEFKNRNMDDLTEAVKDIRVYQEPVAGVEQALGRPLEIVDTGKSETFIKDKDSFWLRVKAYCLGANAVVDYQPGSSIGTPVKYINKEKSK